MPRRPLLSGLVALLIATGASAHDDAHLDTIASPHGGQQRMVGAYHFELVVTPATLQIYVTDHASNPTAAEKASATAIVLSGKSRQTVTLAPKGGNLLEGTGNFDPTQPVKAVVTIQFPDQDALQARFDTAKRHAPAPANSSM